MLYFSPNLKYTHLYHTTTKNYTITDGYAGKLFKFIGHLSIFRINYPANNLQWTCN